MLDTIFTPEQLTYFDIMISSYHVGLTKPDPAMFRLICKQLAAAPEECVMVDDQPRHLAAAAKLGMRTIQYKTADQTIAAIETTLDD